MILDKKSHKKYLVNLLAKSADEYRNFVIPLNVDSGFVRGLIGDNDVVKLDASIGKWMKISSDSSSVTWCTIIEAVENDTLDNNVELADKIRNWLEKDESFAFYVEKKNDLHCQKHKHIC